MEIKFEAYHYDELILASNFLSQLAQLQQKRMQVDREAKISAENQYAKNIGNLTPPVGGQGSVLGGMPQWPAEQSDTTGSPR